MPPGAANCFAVLGTDESRWFGICKPNGTAGSLPNCGAKYRATAKQDSRVVLRFKNQNSKKGQNQLTMNTLVLCLSCEKPNRVPIQAGETRIPICGNCKTPLPLKEGVQEVSASTLTKLVRLADRPVVIDFWAEWCGPCKAFAPTFKAAAKELAGRYIFAKLDTENHPSAAQAFRIRGIPTLVVFKNGQEVDRQSGAMPLPHFLEYLRKWT